MLSSRKHGAFFKNRLTNKVVWFHVVLCRKRIDINLITYRPETSFVGRFEPSSLIPILRPFAPITSTTMPDPRKPTQPLLYYTTKLKPREARQV